ncbi:MAG: hypothetical protein HC880_16835 [Bacteroidia bacterium]|nr:hypothetical protein [Bacteroidia bacterium]
MQGTWFANEWGLYHTIFVQDSTHLALDTHIDTMFFFSYTLEGDTLSLYRAYGQFVNQNVILKLTQDSLVFANLLDKIGVQRYSRKRPEGWPE